MHTVFINTTKNKIGGRFDALKDAKDLKKLMYVDCPLDAWNDEQAGYQSIVEQLADIIDTYNYINNDYNLIVYVDMLEAFELLKVNYLGANEVEQHFMVKLCTSALARLISSTIVEKLRAEGRETVDPPLLLLERPKTKEPSSGADHRKEKMQSLLNVLHLMPPEQWEQKLTGVESVKIGDILDENHKGVKIDLSEVYSEKLQILVDDLREQKATVESACKDLEEAIGQLFRNDCDQNLTISEYYTNKKTQRLSLEVFTKHNFLMQCFILDCVNAESVFNTTGESRTVKQIPALTEQDWEEILTILGQKKRAYEIERQKIINLSSNYSSLNLAPPLYKLAKEKFGLNESGNMSTDFVVQQATPSAEKASGEKGETQPLAEKQVELVEQTGGVQSWFDSTVYKPYDSAGDAYIAPQSPPTEPEEYCARATELANHHLNIFNKLNMHVKRVMSNYASRSISNAPPVLRKRSVNSGENIFDSQNNDYVYAKRTGAGLVAETDPTESVIETSKRAYTTLMLEYLSFDAGRGVAMSNIKEQTEKFINRIRQIAASLKKLGWIFIILALGLAAVYLPFVLIQWNAIVKNVDTLLVALVSLITPYILLFVFYLIALGYQKRKMRDAWDALVAASTQASAGNQRAIAAYDELMTRYIPALRWIYEYVLDVDFHCDCCEIARSKLAHHRDHLFERIETLGNFLEDLDWDGELFGYRGEEKPIEYTNAFCEGEQNSDFYSVIDKKVLDTVHKRK